MKSAYLFASILAPTCIFAQPLDNGQENTKPVRARDIGEPISSNNNSTTEIGFDFDDNDLEVTTTTQSNDTVDSNTTDIPLETRQLFGNYGYSPRIRIDTYTNAHCEGPHHSNLTLIYGYPIPHQMQSYRLHHKLGPNDGLAAFADGDWNWKVSKPADPSLENNRAACSVFAYNLTESVQETKAGCHSLDTRVGCIVIWDVRDAEN